MYEPRAHDRSRRWLAAGLLALVSACGLFEFEPDPPTPANEESTGTSDGSTTFPPEPPSPPPGDSTSGTTGADSSDDADDRTFLTMPDGFGEPACDTWLQDCPRGQKCAPVGNDTVCVTVVDDPDAVGESCMRPDDAQPGLDTCELGARCMWFDARTNTGVCQSLCIGTPAEPGCQDACAQCSQAGTSSNHVCLPACDPIAQDCGPGALCVPSGDGLRFNCSTDWFEEALGIGAACEEHAQCAAGLMCAASERAPQCGDNDCCVAFCDLGAAAPCPDDPDGLVCVPYDDRRRPPGACAEDPSVVGLCVAP